MNNYNVTVAELWQKIVNSEGSHFLCKGYSVKMFSHRVDSNQAPNQSWNVRFLKKKKTVKMSLRRLRRVTALPMTQWTRTGGRGRRLSRARWLWGPSVLQTSSPSPPAPTWAPSTAQSRCPCRMCVRSQRNISRPRAGRWAWLTPSWPPALARRQGRPGPPGGWVTGPRARARPAPRGRPCPVRAARWVTTCGHPAPGPASACITPATEHPAGLNWRHQAHTGPLMMDSPDFAYRLNTVHWTWTGAWQLNQYPIKVSSPICLLPIRQGSDWQAV